MQKGRCLSAGSPLADLCVSLLIVTLDNTVLNVALPALVRDLHATTTELQWIVDAYVMVFAGLLLVAGSLADNHHHDPASEPR
jgi:MFS family permease